MLYLENQEYLNLIVFMIRLGLDFTIDFESMI